MKSRTIEDNYIVTVSHKLKSPLTAVNLYSEALLSGSAGNISSSQKEYLREIHKASKKMVALIDQLNSQYRVNKANK